ncbi:MAG: hypothetical protein Alpg2KO_00070 [Alphaproteobacteria bacterium]
MPEQSIRPPGSEAEAVARLLDAVGQYQRSATLSHRSAATLHKYASPEFDHSMPLKVIAALECEASYPFVTAWLAARAGYRLVPVETDKDSDIPGGLYPALAALGQCAGLLGGDLCLALEQRDLTPTDARSLKQRLTSLPAATARAERELNGYLSGTGNQDREGVR